MKVLILCSILLAAAGRAGATPPCLCPDVTGMPLLDDGVTGIPRNARFFARTAANPVTTDDGTVVPTRFEALPTRAHWGWLVPLEPLAANRTYRFEDQRFTTGDGFDTAAPAVGTVTSRAVSLGGCGLRATTLLEAVAPEARAPGVVMKVVLRPSAAATARTLYLPADQAVVGAFAELDPCGNVPWDEHDAELRARVTLIDIAGNQSAPSPEIAFTLTEDDDPAGCAVGAAPPSPLALLLGAAALFLARRRSR